MDGGLNSVSDNPPVDDSGGAGSDNAHSAAFAYSKSFDDAFPYYLAIGMTYDQFWNDDCNLVRAYRRAARIRRDLRNQDAWIQGMYVYEALCDFAPLITGKKPLHYSNEPYQIYGESAEHKKEKEKKEMDKAKANMEMFAASFNKRFEKK